MTDPFSDLLKLTQAQSLITGGFTAGGDWAIRFPAPTRIKFFAVVQGGCWIHIEGEAEPLRFECGDIGLISAPRAFVLASDPNVPPLDAMALFSGAGKSRVHLGEGQDFAHLGGHVLLDPVSGPLLSEVLPPWIHIPASWPQADRFRALLDQLVVEQAQALPGMQLASAQLAQLLFIQILRAHLMSGAAKPASWLKALVHPRLAPAIRLMHSDPARNWHLETLAQACAMSRTTFATQFKAIAGVAPMSYLTRWRMQLAQRALQTSDIQIAQLASDLGYQSESAFSTAFKRETGHSPRACRLAAQGQVAVSVNLVTPDIE
ncbi:AraC family transcriptional regulator [Saccharospirillum mangrovi]|uniref:AraC family transcriptional regulator n=1 Tax=Saccharospirillum mangrovi TaxID=2161747 RepID=UPI000D332B02|nr:AraC family transcriptional regulator [Saccharospirillum mangrovi]